MQGSASSILAAETGVRVDFVVSGQFPGDGKPSPIPFPDPNRIPTPSKSVCVVDLKTLIELKLASGMTGAGRLQDLADVQRLIQEHRLSRNFAKKLNPYVRERFVELCE